MSKITSVSLPEGLHKALSEIASESERREDIPDMSQSEIIREALRETIEDRDLADLVSEERRILLQRERFMDETAKLRNLRTGFETRVKRHFKNRFENGYKPEQLDKFAENMVRDARILWPERPDGEYADRREEAIEYVERVCAEAKRAAEKSDYDPLDPAEIFDTYEGVRDGEIAETVEQVPDEVRDEIRRRVRRGKSADAIADAIANQYPVDRDTAAAVVEAAKTADRPRDDRPALSAEAMLDD